MPGSAAVPRSAVVVREPGPDEAAEQVPAQARVPDEAGAAEQGEVAALERASPLVQALVEVAAWEPEPG